MTYLPSRWLVREVEELVQADARRSAIGSPAWARLQLCCNRERWNRWALATECLTPEPKR